MAINQALIRPDAVGAFNETFRTVDAAMRDRQRLEMAERQMQENAIQKARENKANDFKMMMMALERGDKLQQNSISNDLQRQQLGISQYGSDTARFSANTARYNAFNPRGPRSRYSGDPLGLGDLQDTGGGGGGGASPGPRIPQEPLPGDPASIRSSYGATTNSDTVTPGNRDVADMLADLNLAGNGGTPASYAPTPEAANDLLGQPPPADTVPANMPLEPPAAPPVAPADNSPAPTPDLRPGDTFAPPIPGAPGAAGPAGAMAPIPAIPEAPVSPAGTIPAAPVDPMAGLLPPPVLPESFANTNLTKDSQATLFNLRRTENQLKKEAALAGSRAGRIMAALPHVDPELVPRYNAALAEAENHSVNASGGANEAAARAQIMETQVEGVKKRQLALASIADLDNVLPATDRAQIARLAADPAGGGQADKLITDMAKYSEVRSALGYDYPSKGLATAQRVARAGAQILSEPGRKDELSWREQTNADRMLAELKSTDTANLSPDEKKDLEKQRDLWRKQSITNAVGAAAHLERLKQVKNAVDADRATDPTPIYDGPLPPPGTPYQDPAAAPAAVPITPLGPPGLGLDTPPVESEMMRNARVKREGAQQQANQFWTQGKEQAFNLARLGDATDAELRSIASGSGGNLVPTDSAPDYAQPSSTQGFSFVPHDVRLADEITRGTTLKDGTVIPPFKMPPGADNPDVTGRRVSMGALGPRDFVRAAAADLLREREAKARGVQPTVAPVPAEKKAAINAGRAAAGLPPL